MVVTRRYSARVSGSAWKPVRCERCQQQFAYQVTREYTGQGVSPYMLDNAGAQERARSSAHRGLEQALASAKEDVPCPKCLTYNADAALRLKKSKFGWMFALGMIAMVGTLTITPILMAPDIPKAVSIIMVLGGFGTGIALLVGRSKMMGNYDPNSEDLRPMRQTTLSAKKTILREQYEQLVSAAFAEGRAGELVDIKWT